MTGSSRTLGRMLGATMLVALGAACSHSQPPRTPSPTFESNVGETTTPPPMGTTAPPPSEPAPSAMTPPEPKEPKEPKESPAPTPEMTSPGGAMGAEAPPAGNEAAPSMTPTPPPVVVMASDLCDSLTHSSSIRYEEIPGGAVLVMTPKPHETIDSVRDDARKFQTTFSQLGAQTPGMASSPAEGTPTCELVEVVHMGASPSITEGPKAVRVLITTSEPSQVRAIRHSARDFARSTGGAHGGKHGGPKSGGH